MVQAAEKRSVETKSGFQGKDQPDRAIMQRCVRCGLCLPSCPTYLETFSESSSPRGRIHLIQSVADGVLSITDPGFVEQMYQCLDCRACEAACPSGVEYGQLVEAARTQIERARRRPAWQRATRTATFRQLFGDMRRFRQSTALIRFYQRSGAQRLARKSGALRVLRMTELEALLPSLPDQFVVPEGKLYPPEDAVTRGRVAVFAGCVMSTVFAETDRATVRVLNASGYEVAVPEGQGCCGALGIHAGEMEDSRELARRNIVAFERSGAEAIIVNAAGCGSALKEYKRLFEDDPEWSARARAFSERVRDVTEFLGDLLARGKLNTQFQPLDITVTFQEPCHLVHAQRISRQPRALLKAIPGLKLVEMEESALCCGSAGIYNIVRPQMARRLGDRKAKNAIATDAQAVVTANPGCHLQVRSSLERNGSPLPVIHIVDVLDAAYRGRMPI